MKDGELGDMDDGDLLADGLTTKNGARMRHGLLLSFLVLILSNKPDITCSRAGSISELSASVSFPSP